MPHSASCTAPQIRIGISACLLGEKVRFDGGHKRDPFIVDTLGKFVQWVTVCPEMEIGLGTPRDTMRLVGTIDAPRLLTHKTNDDLTETMQRFAAQRLTELSIHPLHGYILKNNSPSCGMQRVRVYSQQGTAQRRGRGGAAGVAGRCRRYDGRLHVGCAPDRVCPARSPTRAGGVA